MIVDHITIENFQCFAAPVRLALGPLTFLYGPNSSGKSAIADAMTLLHEVIFEPPGSVLALVRRWSRRAAGDGAAYLPIRLTIEARDNWDCLNDKFEEYFSGLDTVERNRRTRRPHGLPEIEYTIKIVVELRYKSDAFYDHDAISQFDLHIDGYHLIEYRNIAPESGDDGEIKIWPVGPLAQHLSEFVSLESAENAPLVIHETGALWGGQEFFGRFSDAALAAELNGCLSELLQRISQPVRESPLGVFTVSGDRSILAPSRCEVRTRLSGESVKALSGDHPWFIGRLAEAFVGSYLVDVRGTAVVESMREQGRVPHFGRPYKGQTLTEQVNDALSDLFRLNDYQIVFDVAEVRQAATLSTPVLQAARSASDWNVRVYLFDGHNALEFEDVGSGISYVLPVLVALSESCSFMHQPELHLHPAMQGSLADLFVERVSGDDQARHILETHSEYLLLRVLKRIRETHMGRRVGSELGITPDDVMIYYFDPQDDGTTEITEIPVNEFGDFLKPWPKGFFEERGKDLFDD